MLSKITYILKNKKHDDVGLQKDVSNSNDSKDNCIVLSTSTFKNIFLWYFELSKEQCLIDDLGVILNIRITDINSVWYGVCITVHQSTRVSLMTVSVSGNKRNNIHILEAFDDKIHQHTFVSTTFGKQVCFIDSYDIVKTYDDVSSYYCNLIYPLLNDFDRKMRLLLYNTYYILYGEDFSQKFDFYTDTTSDKLKRRKKQNNGTELSSDNIFYAYDYSQMIEILFEKRKIVYNDNDKSDWELYFADKIKFSTCEKDIVNIKNLRNKVAHCKLFSKKDYKELRALLLKYNKALSKAIDLTYSKDFAKEYIVSIKNAIELMSCRMKELAMILSEE